MILETLYLFGDIDREEWAPLLNRYLRPPWKLPNLFGELSFGLAGMYNVFFGHTLLG